jgi:hypothetical protein
MTDSSTPQYIAITNAIRYLSLGLANATTQSSLPITARSTERIAQMRILLVLTALLGTAAQAELEQRLDVNCVDGGKTLYSGPAKLTFPKKGGVTVKTPDDNRFTFKGFTSCTVKPRSVEVTKPKEVF